MRTPLLVAVGMLALAGCGGEAAGGDEPETQTLTVKFRLADYDTAFYDCKGTGGYSDIGTGAPVVVKNGSGKVLGAAKLGKGRPGSNGAQAAFCDWTVKIPDVPADEKFYSVEIASRGEITSSAADLAADDWAFSVSLGEN